MERRCTRAGHAPGKCSSAGGPAALESARASPADVAFDTASVACLQGGLAPQGLTAALRLLKGPVKTMQGRTLQATLTVLARSGGLSSSEMNGERGAGVLRRGTKG